MSKGLDASDDNWGIEQAVRDAAESAVYNPEDPDKFYEDVVNSDEVEPFFELVGEQILDIYEEDFDQYDNVEDEHLEIVAEFSDMGNPAWVRFVLEDGTGTREEPYIEVYDTEVDVHEITDVSRV